MGGCCLAGRSVHGAVNFLIEYHAAHFKKQRRYLLELKKTAIIIKSIKKGVNRKYASVKVFCEIEA